MIVCCVQTCELLTVFIRLIGDSHVGDELRSCCRIVTVTQGRSGTQPCRKNQLLAPFSPFFSIIIVSGPPPPWVTPFAAFTLFFAVAFDIVP